MSFQEELSQDIERLHEFITGELEVTGMTQIEILLNAYWRSLEVPEQDEDASQEFQDDMFG